MIKVSVMYENKPGARFDSIPITCVDGTNDQWAQSPRFFSHL